jgi:S-adenosylmethionine-diacylgycerolhomoserine-N-methlytransferase
MTHPPLQSDTHTKTQMDNMYRWTRHIYDMTRRYYLLGRNRLISGLKPQDGMQLCEIGCGTARNLIRMARKYPRACFFGVDVSDEMLKTARKSVEYSGMIVPLRQGYAQEFNPQTLVSLDKPLDKIVFSYALSIIPPWQESIDHAVTLLPVGGEMHIVDFGGMERLPSWFRRFIFWWLDKFHVYHKPEILEHLQSLETDKLGTLKVTHLYRGYCYIAVFTKA